MMSASSRKGFTLIELILFFTISALMLAGMMVGITGSVNRQRYDDANASLLDFMQSQYNLNDNVRNNRPDTYACGTGGISTVDPQARGASDCTVAGRIIYSSDGKEITSRPVYARSDGDVTISDEADYLDSLGLIIPPTDSTEDDVTYETIWQTTIYTDKSDLAKDDFSVLILRLPSNGLTRTYVVETEVAASDQLASSFWNNGSPPDTLNLCINTSNLTNAPPTGVSIQRAASTSNGVQFIPAGSGVCS